MEILRLGHSSFKITGKDISIVCDPFNPETVGIPFPKVEADVVTISHQHSNHCYKKGVKGNYICFDSPGEYEIKDTEIIGVNSYHDEKNGAERGQNTIFIFEIDGIHVCHLGDLGTELNSEQLEAIDGVDILMIPVGGKVTIDAKKAAKVVSEIEPKIVIPMHYKVGNEDFDNVDVFLKEIGKEPKKQEKLKIQKKELPEGMEVIIL